MSKHSINDLAIFGGCRQFEQPKSTSNLAQPKFDVFVSYSKQFFDQKRYTNNGPLVSLLESRLAKFHHAKHCITMCNGFWALALTIKALAIPGKREIIIPSLTYRRMADIAAWVNLEPNFCEVDKDTLAPTYETVGKCVNDRTALVLGVHPIVNCCDVTGLIQLTNERNIPLLFDSVESMYEACDIGKIGSFGAAECFSLHASKLVNGFEGGYITTNDETLATKLSALRTFGFRGVDHINEAGGLNAKLNEIHAAMALAGLDELYFQVARNKLRYKSYCSALEFVPGIRLLKFDDRYSTSYKNIVVEVLDTWPLSRDETVSILNAENILARAYYSPPLHQKRMLYSHIETKLCQTDELAKRHMLLPCGEFVSEIDISQIGVTLQFLNRKGLEIKSRLSRDRKVFSNGTE